MRGNWKPTASVSYAALTVTVTVGRRMWKCVAGHKAPSGWQADSFLSLTFNSFIHTKVIFFTFFWRICRSQSSQESRTHKHQVHSCKAVYCFIVLNWKTLRNMSVESANWRRVRAMTLNTCMWKTARWLQSSAVLLQYMKRQTDTHAFLLPPPHRKMVLGTPPSPPAPSRCTCSYVLTGQFKVQGSSQSPLFSHDSCAL